MRPVGGLAPPARLGWCRQTGSLNLAAGPAATVSARLVAAATATPGPVFKFASVWLPLARSARSRCARPRRAGPKDRSTPIRVSHSDCQWHRRVSQISPTRSAAGAGPQPRRRIRRPAARAGAAGARQNRRGARPERQGTRPETGNAARRRQGMRPETRNAAGDRERGRRQGTGDRGSDHSRVHHPSQPGC